MVLGIYKNEFCSLILSVGVEARRGQTHLGTYFSTQSRLDASRHLLANFLVILDHTLHLNFTDCFGEGLALDLNRGLQTLSKPFLFLSHQIPYTRMRITLANTVYHQCLQWRRTSTSLVILYAHIKALKIYLIVTHKYMIQ